MGRRSLGYEYGYDARRVDALMARWIESGKEDDRQELIAECLKSLPVFFHKFQHRTDTVLSEVESMLHLGVMMAVSGYKPEVSKASGSRFSTYLYRTLDGYCKRYLSLCTGHGHAFIGQRIADYNKFLNQNGLRDTAKSREAYGRKRKLSKAALDSLSAYLDLKLAYPDFDAFESRDDSAEQVDHKDAVDYILRCCTSRERLVLERLYIDECSMRDVAKELGVCVELVRQIKESAINRIYGYVDMTQVV